MIEPTARLRRRIERDFSAPGSASEAAKIVSSAGDTERVQAAAVIWARGDLTRLQDAHDLALADWRDVLVRAGLADDDWTLRLDVELGES